MQSDAEVLAAFQLCAKLDGVFPALEPAHALAKVLDVEPIKPEDHFLVVNISGRGGKDIFTVADHLDGMGIAPVRPSCLPTRL